MEPLLFLAHRIPFPPDKGDKIRSFNLLKFLASRYRVHLGTFIDDRDDRPHVARLDEFCASSKVVENRPALARIRSLSGFCLGEPLTLAYYRDAALAQWVRDVVRSQRIAKAVVFSSAMAQYVVGMDGLRVVIDFVDVDSAKWSQYARSRPWPLSMVYRREGRSLLAFERAVAVGAAASVFVTPAEADLFRELAPECAERVCHAANGVDVAYFTPAQGLVSPYAGDQDPIVFTGAMDYWPNIDAVTWFVRDILPSVVAARPRARFYIVGMRPAPAVRALAKQPHVMVTGSVPDVRPYLRNAKVVVAPMRVARGVQNKVLEAMAMARPVVVSAGIAAGLSGEPGVDFETAANAPDFARKTVELMDGRTACAIGAAARKRVVSDYAWSVNLAPFATILGGSGPAPVNAG